MVNAAHYKRYVSLFTDLLAAFQKEINTARQTPAAGRSLSEKMLVELDNRCFMIDASHKLSALYARAEEYHNSGSCDTERQIRVLMAQLESTLSSIHEYIVSGRIRFFLRYSADDSMEAVRFVWKGTDYIA